MRFVASGGEALALMEEHPFDVVVSDMRMPGIHGGELLARVRSEHPTTVRIVLSGQANRADVLKVVHSAHQYLAKPCPPDHLCATIARALAGWELRAAGPLATAIVATESLPSPSGIYHAMLAELRKPEPDAAKVVRHFERDPGMAAKLLQIVNSAFFGVPRETGSVRRAASVLGLDTIAALFETEGVFRPLRMVPDGGGVDDGLWVTSSRASDIARALAVEEGFDGRGVDYASTSALLHLVGGLVDLGMSGRGGDNGMRGEVGGYLLGLWGLPEEIVELVAFHDRPSAHPGEPPGVLATVHVACALAAASTSKSPPVLDTAYLSGVQVLDRVEDWRSVAQRVLSEGAPK